MCSRYHFERILEIPVEDYLTATIYLTAMKDTMMTMTKEEAEHILHEPATDKRGK